MKRVLFFICMLAFAVGMSAQEEVKSNWVVGEQPSTTPGVMIQYAVCQQSSDAVIGSAGPVLVSLNIMKLGKTISYFFSVKGDEFVVDNTHSQRVLIQFDGEKASNYSLVGNNSYTCTTLKFESSYKNKFVNLLKKGKKCKITVEFADKGTQEIEFNVDGLDPQIMQ